MNALVLAASTTVAFALAVAPAPAAPQVRASTSAAAVAFGDAFSYIVEARVPAGSPEPTATNVRADVGPFRIVEPMQTERIERGGSVIVRLTQRLACLDDGCVPTMGPRRVELPAARVRVAGAVAVSVPAAVVVRPRVALASVTAGPRAYRRGTQLPPPEGPVAATTAVRLFGTGALVLGVAAIAFAVWAATAMRRRRREDPRARAIRLLRESSRHPPPDRRVAADHLAQVVGRGSAVAEDATALAWSPPDPSGADAEMLAARAARDRE